MSEPIAEDGSTTTDVGAPPRRGYQELQVPLGKLFGMDFDSIRMVRDALSVIRRRADPEDFNILTCLLTDKLTAYFKQREILKQMLETSEAKAKSDLLGLYQSVFHGPQVKKEVRDDESNNNQPGDGCGESKGL